MKDGDAGNVSSDVNFYSFLDEVSPRCSDELDTYSLYTFHMWWQNYKFLKRTETEVAQSLQTAPEAPRIGLVLVTSSATERAFSCAGLILSERGNRLNGEIFEQMLVAKLNAAVDVY